MLTHSHLGGVICPFRALGVPTTVPKQPDIPPRITHFLYHVFQQLKGCHAITNTHISHILLQHTNSSTSGRGNFPIQGPRGPHHSPETARYTPPQKKLPILPIMQPQIPPPATFLYIILTHPHLGRLISPSRALGGPHQSP